MTEPTEAAKVIEELNVAFTEYKATINAALDTKATKDDFDALTKEKLSKIDDLMDKKQAEIDAFGVEQKAVAERIDLLETAAARSPSGDIDPKAELELRNAAVEHITIESNESGRSIQLAPEDLDQVDVDAYGLYCKHFDTYLRKDAPAFFRKMGLDKLETKLLSVDRDPGGGYWIEPVMSSRISSIVFESSPIRQYAAVETIGTDALEMIADLNQAAFGWVGEQESRTETDTPDIGKRLIPAHELYAEPRITQKMLDDAGFDVSGWLGRKVSERFARAEAAAFVTGTGVTQPRGFMTYASGTSDQQIEQVNSGSSGAVTADGLLDLIYSLKGPYLANSRFMMARLTIRDIRKLKDGEGNYLWEPSRQAGQPAVLDGYPVVQADDMAAVASASLSIVFGDFKAAYTIVDRKGIRVLRDPFTAKPYVKLYTTRRVGGDVVNFEAIKIQILS